MARPRRVAAKRTVDKVKEQLAGDEDLKEYNVKSEDTNESSSGIFQSQCVWCFSEGSLLGGHLLCSLPAFSPLFDCNTWKIFWLPLDFVFL
jgi:hypothetical protein